MIFMGFMNLTILRAQKPNTNGIFGAIGIDEVKFRRHAGRMNHLQ